ncbi:hypothetical protein FH972_005930 [Carpinus fangiana]|uniref:RING-type domain-containing protein n=1 Tax=Carpinus fangiana TaxID=176857 RepID=A0A5N6QRR1_9ROSI|nr:hypothetical protein FH972_005930 [Carpinus fangiana]
MKFCKKYQEYMQGQEKKLPGLGFKKLKKILKCQSDFHSDNAIDGLHETQTCPHHCPLCDGTFFPSLPKKMSAVVGCFNKRAQKLLQLHLASGFRKYFIWFKAKLQKNHVTLIQDGKDLDIVFDPVALTCGHIFCYICACSAASVTIVDGLKAVEPDAKCPLCREAGVYEGAVHLDELNILLSRSCPKYWEARLETESGEDACHKRLLGQPMKGIFGCLIRQCHSYAVLVLCKNLDFI